MIKIISNKKGSTLLLVITIIAILFLVGGVMVQGSYYVLKSTKVNYNMENTQFGVNYAAKEFLDELKAKYEKKAMYSVDLELGENSPLIKSLKANYVGKIFKHDVNIISSAANKCDILIDKVEIVKYVYNGDFVDVTLGVTYFSKYYNTTSGNVYSNQKGYSMLLLHIPVKNEFTLNAAVFSIGDFVAKNGGTIDIFGDINSYGTSPEYTLEPEQYRYGGVMTINQSLLRVYGNIFTRSLLRTGLYSTNYDGSKVEVRKYGTASTTGDVIAGGIHVFGNGNRIFVERKAFTFDDLEMNGINSAIGIYKGYYGLSIGNEQDHDSSSAIVNSSPMHFAGPNEADAMKSRIAIEGDMLINGVTFKMKSDGTSLGKMENASTIFFENPALPFPVPAYRDQTFMDINGVLYPTYYSDLFNQRTRLFSQLNIFQSLSANAGFDDWINRVNTAMTTDNSNIDTPSLLTGYANYVIGANKKSSIYRTYFGRRYKDPVSKINSDFQRSSPIVPGSPYTYSEDFYAAYLRNYFEKPSYINVNRMGSIDREFYNDFFENTLSLNDFKNKYINNSSNQPDYRLLNDEPESVLEYLAGLLKKYMLPLCSVFARRTDNIDGISGRNAITTNYQLNSDSKKKVLDHIIDYIYDISSKNSSGIYFKSGGDWSLSSDLGINNALNSNPVKYCLIVNTSANTITIDRDFYGILVTKGRVVFRNPARNVYGSIIAAGFGVSANAPYYAGSANDNPPIVYNDARNIGALNNGTYSGVMFDGSQCAQITINFTRYIDDNGNIKDGATPEEARKNIIFKLVNTNNNADLFELFNIF